MISEFFLDIVFGFVSGIFKVLPDFAWSVDTSAFEYFQDILKIVGYLFPWGTVTAIVVLIFDIMVFRVVISFIKTIWQLLPFT